MNQDRNLPAEIVAVLLQVVGIYPGSSEYPAFLMYIGWSLLYGFFPVQVWGETGGENFSPLSDEEYKKRKTTWPEQYSLCIEGLEIKCIYDEETKIYHAYGLFEQDSEISKKFIEKVLIDRTDKALIHKLPQIKSDQIGDQLHFTFPFDIFDLQFNARDIVARRLSVVAQELNQAYALNRSDNVIEKEIKCQNNSNASLPCSTKVSIKLDDSLLPLIDSLKKEWGHSSRSTTINKLLAYVLKGAPY